MKAFNRLNDSPDSKRPRPTWARRAVRSCVSILGPRWDTPAGCKFPRCSALAVACTRQQQRALSISRSAPGCIRAFASWCRPRSWPSTRSRIRLATWQHFNNILRIHENQAGLHKSQISWTRRVHCVSTPWIQNRSSPKILINTLNSGFSMCEGVWISNNNEIRVWIMWGMSIK